MLSVHHIELPLEGWRKHPGDGLRWRNEAGDQVSLDFFDMPPDLPSARDKISALRGVYRTALGESGGLVEVERIAVAGFAAVQAVFKIPQSPTGMTYVAAITIPFRDCSFVIKWQCPEFGMTGARDATVFALVAPPFDETTGEPIGWARDPYDSSHQARGLRNRSDDPEWDSMFPSHPLSRLRIYLAALGGVRFRPPAATEPPFVGL